MFQIKSEDPNQMHELLWRFIRFTGVGLVSATGHFGLLIALVQLLGTDPVVASAAGALLGALINYSLNYRYTFHSRKRHRESVTKFAVVATIGVLLNTAFMWIGVDVVHAHYLIAQLASTTLVLVWSFSASHWWTFRTI